jgi:hypothetical protein
MWRACDAKIAKDGIFLTAMFAGGALFAGSCPLTRVWQ